MKKILKYINVFYKGSAGIFVEIFYVLFIFFLSLVLNFILYSSFNKLIKLP